MTTPANIPAREIKFRTWMKRYKMMSSWSDVKERLDLVSILTSSNYVVMQFTGLKDKNGVEIYEGDIVVRIYDDNTKGKTSAIEWIGISWCLDNGYTSELFDNNFEVIGNIYENPELLT